MQPISGSLQSIGLIHPMEREPRNTISIRHGLTGLAAATALLGVLSGSPRKAEAAQKPKNQDPCLAQGSELQKSLSAGYTKRADGQHADQALFGIIGGVGFLLAAIPATILVIKRGRHVKRLEAEVASLQRPHGNDIQ